MTLALSLALAYAPPDPRPPADVEPEHDARQLCLVWNRDIGMSKFTDGSWEVVWLKGDDPESPSEVCMAGTDDRVAFLASNGSMEVARLIAAAPDLLAALEQVLETNERADCDLPGCRDQRCLALRAARAAIAKARKGETT